MAPACVSRSATSSFCISAWLMMPRSSATWAIGLPVAMAALAMPYSPNGGVAFSSVIGSLWLGPARQIEPQKPKQRLSKRRKKKQTSKAN